MSDESGRSESDSPTIERYRTAYTQAGESAKAVEEFRSAVVIPAHNELRYAGHHLLLSLSDDGKVSKPEELRKGIRHCERSMYDSSEAGIGHAVRIVNRFKTDYEGSVITDILPNWVDYLQTVREAQEALISGRSGQEIVETIPKHMAHFEKLKNICDRLDDVRSDMNAARRRERRTFWWSAITVVITLLGSLIVASAIYLTN